MKLEGKNLKITIGLAVLCIGVIVYGLTSFLREQKTEITVSVGDEQVIIDKALNTKVNKLDSSFITSDKFIDLNSDRYIANDLKSLKIGNNQPFK